LLSTRNKLQLKSSEDKGKDAQELTPRQTNREYQRSGAVAADE